MFWVYKCNNREDSPFPARGDWADFFREGRKQPWGSTEWCRQVAEATKGDTILAYQTERNELVGTVKVFGHKSRHGYDDLILEPVEVLRAKVRPLKADPKIAAIDALKPGPIRTLYTISPTEAKRLLAAARKQLRQRLAATTEAQLHKAVSHASSRGGGFGRAVENQKVETAAIDLVSGLYRSLKWRVEDVSSECRGYDLLCRKDADRLNIEVKGVAGTNHSFIITENEKNCWSMDKRFMLAVVTNALTSKRTVTEYKGRAALAKFTFKPIHYSAALRG